LIDYIFFLIRSARENWILTPYKSCWCRTTFL